MKITKIILFSAIVGIVLTGCGDAFFDTENAGVASKEEIDEIGSSSPDALIKVVEPLMLGLNNYTAQYNTSGKATSDNPMHGDFGLMSIYHLGDVMNEDLAFEVAGSGWFTYDYQLDYWSEQYVRPYFYWNFFYSIIGKANDIISKISESVTDSNLKAYRGEALVYRAFAHAYLAQMYQQTYIGNEDAPGVPIVLTPEEAESAVAGRAPLRQVYEQIEKDFKAGMQALQGWKRPNKTMIDEHFSAEEIFEDLNRHLPEDIAVTKIKEVDDRFHSRYQAVEKTYRYRIRTSPVPNVFERKFLYQYGQTLDVDKMKKAAQALVGTHDFASFCGNRHMKKSTVRTIFSIDLVERDGEIEILYCGNGFLQNMVRILTGTLIEVGRGERAPESMPALLKAKERKQAGYTAPPQGLRLEKVTYETMDGRC